MTKEQEEAIEILEDIKNSTWTTKYIMSSDSKKAAEVLSMLKEKDEKIEYYRKQKEYDDQFKHELLENIRCKQLTIDNLNKILDDRLICIQGGRGLYTKLRGLDKEYLIREYLSMYKMCKQELKEKNKEIKTLTQTNKSYKGMINKKDRQIDLMSKMLVGFTYYDYNDEDIEKIFNNKQEVKQYFERKSEE